MSRPAPCQGDVLVAPSILSADPLNMARDIARVALPVARGEAAVGQALPAEGTGEDVRDHGPLADFIHVDVMDGHFTENLTIGPAFVKALKRDFATPLDVHLMVDNPEQTLDWYLDAGADLVTVHIEAVRHLDRLCRRAHDRGAMVGVALNPTTPVCWLRDVVQLVDLVLVMSVNPGFGGQSFLPRTLDRLRELSALCSGVGAHPRYVEVDGGVGAGNAGEVCAAARGAGDHALLVAGSAVFGAADPASAVAAIRAAGAEGFAPAAEE